MPMDEKTRFQSAFAMAQTMGASPDKLVQTAQHYLDVLKNEENKFEKALASQQQKQIGSKEGQIAKLDEVIREKSEKIKELTQEIQQHQQEMKSLKDEIQDAVVKVETTKNDFHASYDVLIRQIAKDMENMKNYLK
jgi:chromosome segregation ATPase